jgi:hypothetical protein
MGVDVVRPAEGLPGHELLLAVAPRELEHAGEPLQRIGREPLLPEIGRVHGG